MQFIEVIESMNENIKDNENLVLGQGLTWKVVKLKLAWNSAAKTW